LTTNPYFYFKAFKAINSNSLYVVDYTWLVLATPSYAWLRLLIFIN